MSARIADNWNTRAYGHNARFVADLTADLVDWLDPQPGECVMDLGCGDGALMQVIADRGAHVMGVDASPTLLDAAHERGIQTVLGDGQALDDVVGMRGVFDAVFSNAALHCMTCDPQAVINGVAARLHSGGRFVAEMGAAGNVAPIRDTLRLEVQRLEINADNVDPWYFPTEKHYLAQLTDAGFFHRTPRLFRATDAVAG